MSLAKVEFAKLGLFLTLGNITPRFLLFGLAVLEDVAVIGVVELVGLFEGEATDDIDVVVDKGGEAVGTVDVGISVTKSSVTLIYLGINDMRITLCLRCFFYHIREITFDESEKFVESFR